MNDPSPEREGLRAIWLEAHETIPPDGKDAAFAALGRIMKLASEALSTHPGRPTRAEVAETLMNVVRMEHRLPPITAAQCGAGANRYFAMADAILSLFRSLGGEA